MGLMEDVKLYADEQGIDFLVTRIASRQTLRSNYPTNGPIEYYRI